MCFLSWFMTAIALCGTFLNANQNRAGFYFWLASNLFFCLYNGFIEQYALSVLFGVYFLLAIQGLRKWK